MDVLSIQQISIVNDPILLLASSNGGHYRIYLRFLNDVQKGNMPLFGTFTSELAEFRVQEIGKIESMCKPIPLQNDPEYAYWNERGAYAGDFIFFDFFFKEKANIVIVRAKMMDDVNRIFSQWTGLWESEIASISRFCFTLRQGEFEVWDSKNFDSYWLGTAVSHPKFHYCSVCFSTLPISDIVYQQCGHGTCEYCFRRWEKDTCPICSVLMTRHYRVRNRITPCPIDGCHRPFEENHYMMVPCRCLLTHSFKPFEMDRFIGQQCPYKTCQRRVEAVKKIYVDREPSGHEQFR